MTSSKVLLLLVFSILPLPPMLGPDIDATTREGMQQRAEFLNKEMDRQLEQLEQANLEREKMEKIAGQKAQSFSWERFPLFTALQQWEFWMAPGNLVLLGKLCSWLWSKTYQQRSKHGEESPGSKEEESRMKEEEEEEEEESDEEESDWEGHLFGDPMRRSSGRVTNMRQTVTKLVSDLLHVLRERLSDGFFPELQPAIGVGSAFEGWGPCGYDAKYCLVVPLKPPRGHTFTLELGTAQEVPAKHRIRVDVECTCKRKTPARKNTSCFVHQRLNRDSSLLGKLCTGRYLDAEKTAHWFQGLVSSTWGKMPLSRRLTLRVLPSSRSCKVELTDTRGRSLCVEMMFGIQQGKTDVFLTSQAPEAIFPLSFTWAESYAVAEAKFFDHLARQAPQDTFHLKCLEIYAANPVGTVLSSSFLKTAIMHLLNFIPLSGWRKASYLTRLRDIMAYLHSCLKKKCLDHFFYGNELLPKDIVLPLDVQEAEPFNIFECLVQDSEAYDKALQELQDLEERLMGILSFRV